MVFPTANWAAPGADRLCVVADIANPTLCADPPVTAPILPPMAPAPRPIPPHSSPHPLEVGTAQASLVGYRETRAQGWGQNRVDGADHGLDGAQDAPLWSIAAPWRGLGPESGAEMPEMAELPQMGAQEGGDTTPIGCAPIPAHYNLPLYCLHPPSH